MTTPSAYRMATTVVPCVTCGAESPPAPVPSGTTASPPTRFSSSLKLGPGSLLGKSGRLIRREALPAPPSNDACISGARDGRRVQAPLQSKKHAQRGTEPRRAICLLSALLHVVTDEVLGVFLEHFVDFVQQFVQFGFDLFALLGRCGGGLFDFFLLALGWLALLLLSLWHGYLPRTSTTPGLRAALQESRNPSTTYRHVPLFL